MVEGRGRELPRVREFREVTVTEMGPDEGARPVIFLSARVTDDDPLARGGLKRRGFNLLRARRIIGDSS